MTSGLSILVLAAVGCFAFAAVLLVRAVDQRARDDRRVVVGLRFPRRLNETQVAAVVRVLVGLVPAAPALRGRSSVACEIVGTHDAVSYQMRLPEAAHDYIVGQLRAAVPGIAIDEKISAKFQLSAARELRRSLTEADFAVRDAATVARTLISALTGLKRGEAVVWQLVVTGGISPRPDEQPSLAQRLTGDLPPVKAPKLDHGVVGISVRIGAQASSAGRAQELLARLLRAVGSLSAPGARLVPRLTPADLACSRTLTAATHLLTAPVLVRVEELVALLAWPIDAPLIPGLTLGGSPQLPAASTVPRTGRLLGQASVGGRPVAQPLVGAREHSLILGPTGSGKSWLSNGLFLGDIEAGRGGLIIDPKGSAGAHVLDRLPASAIGRTIVVDPTDEARPVPIPLLSAEAGGIPELAADTLVGLLRHRYRDLGPRSSDILSSSLYALTKVPNATIADLLPLWSDAQFRSYVAGLVAGDSILAGFFAWFEGLGAAERDYILAAPLNKIRPLLQRPVVRNVLAAPRATFTMAEVLRDDLIVVVMLPEGSLGSDATSLIGQAVTARLWAAVQARRKGSFFSVTIDEAPRFLDQPTDLGELLARSREYGVGLTLIGQTLGQFPQDLREIALNSARTKIAFGTSHTDARRLAEEFGPGVEADFFTGLARYEAIGAVSLGGTVSPPFTFTTLPLGAAVAGRAKAIRAASRERWGIPREELEASFTRRRSDGGATPGSVGRRQK